MEDNIEYQTVDYHYPKIGYLPFTTHDDNEGVTKAIVSMSEFYESKKDLVNEIVPLLTDKTLNSKRLHITEWVIIEQLQFVRYFKLKKSYWDSPSVRFTGSERQSPFLNTIERPEIYEILVAPTPTIRKNNDKGVRLMAVAPFVKGSPAKVIDNFLSSCTWPVDPKSKNAAIYAISEAFSLNIKTGYIIKKPEKKVEENILVN